LNQTKNAVDSFTCGGSRIKKHNKMEKQKKDLDRTIRTNWQDWKMAHF